ncbi:hypothetical protein AMTRI_Chr01g103110 [Amborella trichopoda]|uniref:uncharacterized protein LOC110006653 isoform X3 n=1 Tax=Amborella trichopoda TaxID=13333 RepID=UPI0009BD0484|nr:uncharacterized protein LOC110006653 isoform X3 [Amborella trichopoda]XP_020518526.1 uncharacterized protein LOC110006653 isoform X3 [Amborella trichopoda]XP_020518527.1 uncharacterized protein LOC110006653 isoform X3 [Amborella trichopoda]XP_020518528.1 uncharacterized protein LOC110006653 isoform X3 [Amborella trichopoda]XP_020518529.1 uncharacterized protein LOC110006653 isoform X3 [Amborella trichopoda]XP_020518530.1 uncharacterized protein LOC110006653 isoform X3 [Amborella trichopoda]|eukprot:XP_020518525.1 uncharacterized protein LOC110006653 isoform X3 [Amborella trichopoda]
MSIEAKFFRFLKIVGVGFKARAEAGGRMLFLKLGYSHGVELTVPPTVRVFFFKPNIICCTGIHLQRVAQFAAAVRSCKPPEVYKGKGIMYLDEVVKKKLRQEVQVRILRCCSSLPCVYLLFLNWESLQ